MRYRALVADYDGTLAYDGFIGPPTWTALRRLRSSGRALVMATGRLADDVLARLPDPAVFARIVAENGAVVYRPRPKETHVLAPAPPAPLLDALARRGVPVSTGRVIIATHEPYREVVLDTIREAGLALQVILNKGAVMILPDGIDKATGAALALGELGLSLHDAVAVGDAENDLTLLAAAECGVAVANAHPGLADVADHVLSGANGAGIAELVDAILADRS